MSLNLTEYNKKRNFDKTGEPEGEVLSDNENLRFVVQHHIARKNHFDLRLEWNGVLLSWAVPKGPSFDTRDKRLAIQVEEHPIEYKNFEGVIPKGEYGGGVVMIWDEGYWEPHGNVEDGLENGMLKFTLNGRRLKGKWALVRIKSSEKTNWLFIKEKDEYAKETSGISEFDTSIRTGRTMAEIEHGEEEKLAKNPFGHTDVQLAKLVSTIPDEDDWLYEMKYDGYRIIAFVEGNNTRLITRNGNDYTRHFQSVASSLSCWAGVTPMVLDGEMVVTDAFGRTDFQALQSHIKNPGGQNLTYIIFDLLALDGVDLRTRSLLERKEMLESLTKNAPKNIYYSRHVKGHGKECLAAACKAGMEGIIGKKADSVYSGKRDGSWIKIKCEKRQEFVIGGYTLSDKRDSGISSLLLGLYEGNELFYAGRAGSGIGCMEAKNLLEKFEGIIREESPFNVEPKSKPGEKITWLEPRLVAEIRFAEWTRDNLLRQASFKGIRTDKNPTDIKREKADDVPPQSKKAEEKMDLIIEGVKITNPQKVMFEEPIITKEDVVRYYESVSERMLPYVQNRVLSIVRCPKGISDTCFYKKHPGTESKGVAVIPITNKDGDTEDYFYIESKAGLIWEAQMGTLEFHIWGSSVSTLEMPDIMVFDLDPDEDMELDRVRLGVMDLKGILQELGLNSYLKTSGGKGYHVVVPIKPAALWDKVHDFAKSIAEVMEQKWPDRYTSNVRKSKRTGKIFIDWIRNGRGSTSIAPYSLRARKGAGVSMPIAWDELYSVSPDSIKMSDALLRIKNSNPWNDFFQNNQAIKT